MDSASSFLAPIENLPGVRAGWCGRLAGVEVGCGRDEVMARLRRHHAAWLARWSGGDDCANAVENRFWRAEQVHGNRVAVVPGVETITAADGLPCVADVDGLITATPGMVLGIYVADCGPIWVVDPVKRVVGLLHSGKKGSKLNILGVAIGRMSSSFGCDANDLVVVLGPCIRPPDYEVDFAALIARQAVECGVGVFSDCGINTADDLEVHYSYRAERGMTGRMLATIQLD